MVAWQIGRPLWQADETPRLKLIGNLAGLAAGEALADEGMPADPGIRRFVRHQAQGVMLSICAWNYPVAMLGYLVTAPLIAGNVVIFKHSPQTPTVGDIAAEAFAEAGLPDGVFQAIDLRHQDAERMIASGRLRAVNFIGSVAGGRRVHAAAAGTFTNVHLELGGKDPAYIRSDADLDKAIPLLIEGCYSNSGQSCCSVERIYVHAGIYRRFVDAFVAQAADVTLANPLDGKPYIGPVVRASAAANIRAQIDDAVAKGARRLLEPGRTNASALGPAYVEPEVLVDVDHSMSIMRDETFGPVAAIQMVRDDAEAVALMNDSDYGLSASVWTSDTDTGLRAARRGGGRHGLSQPLRSCRSLSAVGRREDVRDWAASMAAKACARRPKPSPSMSAPDLSEADIADARAPGSARHPGGAPAVSSAVRARGQCGAGAMARSRPRGTFSQRRILHGTPAAAH